MTLKEAIRVLLEDEHLEDFVYTVRDRAAEEARGTEDWRTDRWELPRVKRFIDAVKRLKEEHESGT